jgi:hypothetical protein
VAKTGDGVDLWLRQYFLQQQSSKELSTTTSTMAMSKSKEEEQQQQEEEQALFPLLFDKKLMAVSATNRPNREIFTTPVITT